MKTSKKKLKKGRFVSWESKLKKLEKENKKIPFKFRVEVKPLLHGEILEDLHFFKAKNVEKLSSFLYGIPKETSDSYISNWLQSNIKFVDQWESQLNLNPQILKKSLTLDNEFSKN